MAIITTQSLDLTNLTGDFVVTIDNEVVIAQYHFEGGNVSLTPLSQVVITPADLERSMAQLDYFVAQVETKLYNPDNITPIHEYTVNKTYDTVSCVLYLDGVKMLDHVWRVDTGAISVGSRIAQTIPWRNFVFWVTKLDELLLNIQNF